MQGDHDDLLKSGFIGIESVVADPLRFKLRLGIGEDAYASLRLKKNLQELWDTGGMAATGAAVATSHTVAATLFAPTGLLAIVGLGTAVTPIGWVAAAAIGSAGAYYGVTRLYGRFAGSRVETIPKFINTPLDLLAASLLDLMGALALRLAHIDGKIDDTEIKVISDYFVADWGFDSSYVKRAIELLSANVATVGVKELARQLATFQVENPDCNPTAMRTALLTFLHDVMSADGVLDEREQLAIDAIAAVMKSESERSFRTARRHIAGLSEKASAIVSATATRLRSAAGMKPTE